MDTTPVWIYPRNPVGPRIAVNADRVTALRVRLVGPQFVLEACVPGAGPDGGNWVHLAVGMSEAFEEHAIGWVLAKVAALSRHGDPDITGFDLLINDETTEGFAMEFRVAGRRDRTA